MRTQKPQKTRKRLQEPVPATFQALLVRYGLSQVMLARKLKMDPSYISHIALGRKQPSLGVAVKMAAVLGVSLDAFQKSLAKER